ncbi:hypothetical protein [Rubritalea marina]|uniref:hypothetical protein n=1 Tax=Rubritalea marina TaxID=361055 RepID=UPI0003668F2D|nr:hypothetical protein [Rubritalea marina]
MDQELKDFEEQLKAHSPEMMPEDMIKRMASAMDQWGEGSVNEENIIPFQAAQKLVADQSPQTVKSKLRFFNTWAQAAAVALVAAVSYLMLNQGDPSASQASAQVTTVEPLSQQVPMANIESAVPASNPQQPSSQFSSQLKNATQDVITYDANGRAVRLMQVEFEDEVIVRDREGNPHVIKQPRVEYYAVPAEIH